MGRPQLVPWLCCHCSRPVRTGPARTWRAASGCPTGRSATTCRGSGSSVTRSTPSADLAADTASGWVRAPPHLLDDEEAVAVAVGLRAATGVSGVEETGARALAQLEQVLPDRLRRPPHWSRRPRPGRPTPTATSRTRPSTLPSSRPSRWRSATTTASAATTATSRWRSSRTTWSRGSVGGTSSPAPAGRRVGAVPGRLVATQGPRWPAVRSDRVPGRHHRVRRPRGGSHRLGGARPDPRRRAGRRGGGRDQPRRRHRRAAPRRRQRPGHWWRQPRGRRRLDLDAGHALPRQRPARAVQHVGDLAERYAAALP